jgi:hypothetical protein
VATSKETVASDTTPSTRVGKTMLKEHIGSRLVGVLIAMRRTGPVSSHHIKTVLLIYNGNKQTLWIVLGRDKQDAL